jgi:hypothetical protein
MASQLFSLSRRINWTSTISDDIHQVKSHMQASFAPTFQKAAIVPRAALYGTDSDPQLPASLLADARVPFLGYCGPRYSVGNPILLAINPGGGSDDYSERHAEDEELIPLIEAFVHAQGSATPKAFEKMCHVYMEHVQTWNLRNIVTPTLAACGKGVDEVCYLNVFPYRTRKNAMPSAKALSSVSYAPGTLSRSGKRQEVSRKDFGRRRSCSSFNAPMVIDMSATKPKRY